MNPIDLADDTGESRASEDELELATKRKVTGESKAPSAGWRAKKPLILLVALCALAAWELGATVKQHLSAATSDDWRAAAQVVLAERRDNDQDALIFAPHWVAPLARHHFAGQLSMKMATLSDVDRYDRVWEISIRGAKHKWLGDLKAKKTWNKGAVTVRRYEKKPATVLFDFFEKIDKATVDRAGKALTPCKLEQGKGIGGKIGPRFVCDAHRSWNWVGPYLAEVGHQPYSCIYVHPVDSHRMRVRFAGIPVGDKLVIHTGIDDFENRKRSNVPVLLQVFVDDRLIGTVRHENDWPWRRTELKLQRSEKKTAAVRFEITAQAAFARPFCFRASMRR